MTKTNRGLVKEFNQKLIEKRGKPKPSCAFTKQQTYYTCPHVDCVAEKFTFSEHVIQHRISCHGYRPWTCKYTECQATFSTLNRLNTHNYRFHSSDIKSEDNLITVNKEHNFTEDTITTTNSNAHHSDKTINKINNLIIDKYTDKNDHSEQQLRDCYKPYAITNSTKRRNVPVPVQCPIEGCHVTWRHKFGKERHMNIHVRQQPFSCTLCSRKFTTKYAYQRHVATIHRIHDQTSNARNGLCTAGPRQTKCKSVDCDQWFSSQTTAHTHFVMAHKEASFKCRSSLCGRMFTRREMENKHFQRFHGPNAGKYRKRAERNVELALQHQGYKEFIHAERQTLPPPGYYRREMHIDFNCVEQAQTTGENFARIDFVIAPKETTLIAFNGHIFLEVDEQQHRYGQNSLVSCDMRRMARVEESRTLSYLQDMIQLSPTALHSKGYNTIPKVMWLRYNPNNFREDGIINRWYTSIQSRTRILVDYITNVDLVVECGTSNFCLRYLFYDTIGNQPSCTMHEHYHDQFLKLAKSVPPPPPSPHPYMNSSV